MCVLTRLNTWGKTRCSRNWTLNWDLGTKPISWGHFLRTDWACANWTDCALCMDLFVCRNGRTSLFLYFMKWIRRIIDSFWFLFHHQFLRQGKIPEDTDFFPISRLPKNVAVGFCRQYSRKSQVTCWLFWRYSPRAEVKRGLPWCGPGNQQVCIRSSLSKRWVFVKTMLMPEQLQCFSLSFWCGPLRCVRVSSMFCPAGCMRFSPAGLQHRLSAELNYLSAIEESVRQLSDLERVRGISLAQQESVSLAQILKVMAKYFFVLTFLFFFFYCLFARKLIKLGQIKLLLAVQRNCNGHDRASVIMAVF